MGLQSHFKLIKWYGLYDIVVLFIGAPIWNKIVQNQQIFLK